MGADNFEVDFCIDCSIDICGAPVTCPSGAPGPSKRSVSAVPEAAQ
jgi:hypothetical protein